MRKQINSKYAIEWDDAHDPHIVNQETGTPIPDDEPVFLLRGKDATACRTLGYYAGVCRSYGSPDTHIAAVAVVYGVFQEFARKHPDRLKVPGAEPDLRSPIAKIHG